MVTIVNKEKSELEKKLDSLEELTKEVMPTSNSFLDVVKIIGNLGFYTKKDKKSPYITVDARDNSIKLDKKEGYDSALKLAEAYEKFTKKEWTLKKDYYG